MSNFFLCVRFGQVAYAAMGQVLCMCPGHGASLGVQLLHPLLCSLVKIPHIKKDFKIKSSFEEVCLSVEGSRGGGRQLLARSKSETVLASPAGCSLQLTQSKS